jgi:hypothetical protein
LLGESTTGAQEATMHHHHSIATALALTAIVTLAPAEALAQPAHDAAAAANARADTVHRHHPSATRPSITFTNPLGRSRGPGAGAGLL